MKRLTIVGGGLAGSEAAWQVAEHGINVDLVEMRPSQTTGAHLTSDLAELICSNSLGSTLPDRASGILLSELQSLNSMLIKTAYETVLPAGQSLAVDRARFSQQVTSKIYSHPRIRIIRGESVRLPPPPAIIATGPLTSPSLSESLKSVTGVAHLYFYDAISPSILAESIDHSIAYHASRYSRGMTHEGDYLNCPLTEDEYSIFVENLTNAKRYPLMGFESAIDQGVTAGYGSFFEGCLPIEVMASRNPRALAFGPMRPVGLSNPRSSKRIYAVVQLRQENIEATTYNMVGFQTNLLIPEQQRIFSMIPGLEHAEFTRFGQMHRNTYMASPILLAPTLMLKNIPGMFFAGQLAGIEGYLGNIASGLLAGLNAVRFVHGQALLEFPRSTMLGALCLAICESPLDHFQPIKANIGIIQQPPGLDEHLNRRQRAALIADNSSIQMKEFLLRNRIVYA